MRLTLRHLRDYAVSRSLFEPTTLTQLFGLPRLGEFWQHLGQRRPDSGDEGRTIPLVIQYVGVSGPHNLEIYDTLRAPDPRSPNVPVIPGGVTMMGTTTGTCVFVHKGLVYVRDPQMVLDATPAPSVEWKFTDAEGKLQTVRVYDFSGAKDWQVQILRITLPNQEGGQS